LVNADEQTAVSSSATAPKIKKRTWLCRHSIPPLPYPPHRSILAYSTYILFYSSITWRMRLTLTDITNREFDGWILGSSACALARFYKVYKPWI